MKKRILTILLCVSMILPLSACGKDLPQEETVKNTQTDVVVDLDDAYNKTTADERAMDFSVRLFQQSVAQDPKGQTNTLISPVSVLMALSMTSNGANGDTLTQIEDALGMTQTQLNSYAYDYIKNLPQDDFNKLMMANSIWYTDDERFTVEQDFLNNIETYYDGEVREVAFVEETCNEINAWVEENTDGAIKEILDEIPANAVMYVINALVFEAEWLEPYDEMHVSEGMFQYYEGIEECKQPVDMMYSEEFLYLEDEMATGFIKYYEGKKYAFVALLPKEGYTVQEYVAAMTGENLQTLLDNPIEVHVEAALPCFETEYYSIMNDTLIEMGIVDAFQSDKADLSNLGTSTNGNIWVNRVIHKTYITVGAMGTKAGAATIVEAVDESASLYEETKVVTLDRPFIYMIIDCENNQPIFMGTLNYVYPYRCGAVCEFAEIE